MHVQYFPTRAADIFTRPRIAARSGAILSSCAERVSAQTFSQGTPALGSAESRAGLSPRPGFSRAPLSRGQAGALRVDAAQCARSFISLPTRGADRQAEVRGIPLRYLLTEKKKLQETTARKNCKKTAKQTAN